VERKTLALLIIVLLVGLLVGYILNYAIYQPQIQNLINDVGALNAKVENYGNAINNLNAAISKLDATVSGLNSTSQSNSTSETTPSNESTYVEDLTFLSANATKIDTTFGINFSLQNTGTATAALTLLYLNGTPQENIPELTSIVLNGTAFSTQEYLVYTLYPRDTVYGSLTLAASDTFTSGTSVTLTLETGPSLQNDLQSNQYGTTVVLP
jgi:hypothetical protein